jgi:hypothetical protein
MFVIHIIKTLHVSVKIVWPSSVDRLLFLVLLLLLCLFASSSCLFGMWLYVVCNIIFALEWFHDFIYTRYEESEAYDGKWCRLTYVCACLMYLSVGCLVVNCLLRRVAAARVHITGLVRWTAVPWWVGFDGGIFECTCFPSGSFSYFSCLVVLVLECRLLSHIYVCYSVYKVCPESNDTDFIGPSRRVGDRSLRAWRLVEDVR